MIDTPLFHGRLVKLVAPDPEKDARFLARWSHDSEYLRLFDAAPARPRPVEEYQEKLEKQASKADEISFMITPLSPAAEQPIGIVELDGIQWPHQTAWVGIGLGEKEYWGKWYGTDAMRVVLRYGFTELDLHRISITVYEYNRRAIRVYEKLNFVTEGRARGFLRRDGRRWDMLFMGLLRPEWESTDGHSEPTGDEDRLRLDH